MKLRLSTCSTLYVSDPRRCSSYKFNSEAAMQFIACLILPLKVSQTLFWPPGTFGDLVGLRSPFWGFVEISGALRRVSALEKEVPKKFSAAAAHF